MSICHQRGKCPHETEECNGAAPLMCVYNPANRSMLATYSVGEQSQTSHNHSLAITGSTQHEHHFPLQEAGPDVEASQVIEEWRRGRSSTEIASMLRLNEIWVASVIRREILEHPQQATHKERTGKPDTITRLKALKREMQKKSKQCQK